ncbi:hypothetical protein [Pseudooceanicola sp. LIPI14-2-Ac024]|uniref:hypothetical protein n=1 Tax=Pseudooceanicola sp. LIPI14-2-Ac024 TaxID=3344875 RepID=UPI0035CF0A28
MCLSACVEGDIALEFTDTDHVVSRSAIHLSHPAITRLGVAPAALCGAGRVEETAEGHVCFGTARGDVDTLMAGLVDLGGIGGEVDLSEALTVRRLGSDRLRVSLDIEALVMAYRAADPGMLGAMLARQASHGASGTLVIRLRAADIVGTTGGVSVDGREAFVAIPAALFTEADPDFGGPFITVLELREGCTFGLFCE